MSSSEWKLGDRVMHAGKPEWGVGEVRSAQPALQEGRKCQRLTVRFERAGIKTLTTAFADLRPASEMPTLDHDPDVADLRPDAHLKSLEDQMTALPDAATDPFRGRRARMEAAAALYRFTGSGASLLDWASVQSGLADPLSKFTRPQLEQMFDRFRTNLDAHARKVARELEKEDPAALAAVLAAAPGDARQALRRLDSAR